MVARLLNLTVRAGLKKININFTRNYLRLSDPEEELLLEPEEEFPPELEPDEELLEGV